MCICVYVCMCVRERESERRGWAGPRAAAAPWTGRTHRPYEAETLLPEAENEARAWVDPND